MAAFLPYPDSLVLLLIHPEVTRMVHSRLCYQIELGRCFVKRAAYTAEGHVITICGVWLFGVDVGDHDSGLREYATATDFEVLERNNVENPIRLPRSLFDTDVAQGFGH